MKPRDLVLRLTVIAFLGSLPVTTGACGFALTHGPPDGHEQMDHFTCTESDLGQLLDFVWAGIMFAGVVDESLNGSDQNNYSGVSSGAAIAVGLTWGLLSASAGVVGLTKTKKCRNAKRQLAERQARGRPAEQDHPADMVVQTVVLTPAVDTLTVGEQVQLTAAAYNSGGAFIANKMFAWSSSNDAIASVSGAGQVTAHAIGAVVIAARTDGIAGTSSIVVVSPR